MLFFFVVLQERFLENAKLSPDYFIAECEDMLVILSLSPFSLFVQVKHGTLQYQNLII
jgi:hypothetical protein